MIKSIRGSTICLRETLDRIFMIYQDGHINPEKSCKSCLTTVRKLKAHIICGRPEDRWHLLTHQSQVDGHLPAVVRPVTDRVLNDLGTWSFPHNVSTGQ